MSAPHKGMDTAGLSQRVRRNTERVCSGKLRTEEPLTAAHVKNLVAWLARVSEQDEVQRELKEEENRRR